MGMAGPHLRFGAFGSPPLRPACVSARRRWWPAGAAPPATSSPAAGRWWPAGARCPSEDTTLHMMKTSRAAALEERLTVAISTPVPVNMDDIIDLGGKMTMVMVPTQNKSERETIQHTRPTIATELAHLSALNVRSHDGVTQQANEPDNECTSETSGHQDDDSDESTSESPHNSACNYNTNPVDKIYDQ